MHITAIEPANMKGCAGNLIQDFNGFLDTKNNVFAPRMPSVRKQLWYRCDADGEHLPHMIFKGPECFLNEIMDGQFGEDYAASIRNQDPKFAAAMAAAFPMAASGRVVNQRIQMEVTPPGHLQPYYVDYYRSLRVIEVLGKRFVSVLVEPTDAWRSQLWRYTEVPYGSTPLMHS